MLGVLSKIPFVDKLFALVAKRLLYVLLGNNDGGAAAQFLANFLAETFTDDASGILVELAKELKTAN